MGAGPIQGASRAGVDALSDVIEVARRENAEVRSPGQILADAAPSSHRRHCATRGALG